MVQPIDRTTWSHHRRVSRSHRSSHRMSSWSERASRWYTVLWSAEWLAMRRKVRIPGTRWYKWWSRGARSANELRWRTRRRTERTGPGPIVRWTGIIRGWRKTGGIRRRSRTGCRGTARRGGGGVLWRRRAGRRALIRRCSGWTTSTARKWTRSLEACITRWTACVIVWT